MLKPRLMVVLLPACLLVACGGDDAETDSLTDASPYIERYVAMVREGYTDSRDGAEALQTAITAFVESPSADRLEVAQNTWLDARESYGQTEVFRFYGGPIDDEDGPEGRINSWPLDEAFIDYVEGDTTAGIINNAADFPTISADVLADQNEQGGETNIATGYHAIEFLLWGQDQSADGPGDRPFTDYVDGDNGTVENQTRRAEYLTAVTELLVDDLSAVVDEWADTDGTYADDFVALDPKQALTRIITGMGSLSGAELSGERMGVAYDNIDQEDEHSCFSDNTHRDIYLNAIGIRNVYLGESASGEGASLSDLVHARDPALDATMREQLDATMDAIEEIPAPFDQAIQGADTDPGRTAMKAAIDALRAETETIVRVASLLGITINLE